MICGVIYDPVSRRNVHGGARAGAYLNNRRIRVSSVKNSRSRSWPPDSPAASATRTLTFTSITRRLCGRTASVAPGRPRSISLGWPAGRLEAYWEFGLKPWDMAAGILLVAEAGGKVSDMHGEPARIGGRHLLTTNGHVHDQVLGLFSEVFNGQYRTPLPEPTSAL